MTHVLTYHNTLARRYMRLSATIEVETALAQHNKRKVSQIEFLLSLSIIFYKV